MPFAPTILIVEDDTESADRLRRTFMSLSASRPNVHLAKSTRQAEELLQLVHFHGMSIDQAIPNELGSSPTEQEVLAFLGKDVWPLTTRVIYAGNGSTIYSNLAGLSQVLYREKHPLSNDGIHRTLYGYCEEFIKLLSENYVEQALRAAGRLLPYSLANPAIAAADAKHVGDWGMFFHRLDELRERALKLVLAVTYAGMRTIRVSRTANSAKDVETALQNAWNPVPPALRRYVLRPDDAGSAGRFIGAMEQLRQLRNANAHYEYWQYVERDYVENEEAIVALLGLLAFLCETPIMHGPRFHETKRTQLTFQKMGPNKIPVRSECEAIFDPPSWTDGDVFVPWKTDGGLLLLNLSPWIVARRNPSKILEFCINFGASSEIL